MLMGDLMPRQPPTLHPEFERDHRPNEVSVDRCSEEV